jgi:hypothetical protein
MFMGSTPEAINRELSTMVEAALVCRRRNARALGTTEFALWNLGMELKRMILDEEEDGVPLSDQDYRLCRGILPSLRGIVRREFGPIPACIISHNQAREGAATVDVNMDDLLDEGEYNCQICNFELANTYVRSLRGTSQRLCVLCHDEGLGGRDHRRCYRLTGPNGAFRMLQTIERKVGEDQIPYSSETEVRLRIAENRFSAAHSEKAKLLANVGSIHAPVDDRKVAPPASVQVDNSAVSEPHATSEALVSATSVTNGANEDQPSDEEADAPLSTRACSSSATLMYAPAYKKSAAVGPPCTIRSMPMSDDSAEATAMGTNEDPIGCDSKVHPTIPGGSNVPNASGANSASKDSHPFDVLALTKSTTAGVKDAKEDAGPATSSSHGASDALVSSSDGDRTTDKGLVAAALSQYTKAPLIAESAVPFRFSESLQPNADSPLPQKPRRRSGNDKESAHKSRDNVPDSAIARRSTFERLPLPVAKFGKDHLQDPNALSKSARKARRPSRRSNFPLESLTEIGGGHFTGAKRLSGGAADSAPEDSDASSLSPACKKRRNLAPAPSSAQASTGTRRAWHRRGGH